jgi:beta-lactamase class C
LEFEVMDQIYRLPFRDWLELDRSNLTPQQTIAGADSEPENGGGDRP